MTTASIWTGTAWTAATGHRWVDGQWVPFGDPDPPVVTPSYHGATINQPGISATLDFQANTYPLDFVRAFPAGKTLEPSLGQVDQVIANFPGRFCVWSCFMANRGFSGPQVASFASAIRDRADELPMLYIFVDAEMDRRDDYTPAQFVAGFDQLRSAVGSHAKIKWGLNLTGYLFSTRWPIWGQPAVYLADVLAVDPYWRQDLTYQGQGGREDVLLAKQTAIDNGLEFAIGEYGAERGSNQITNLHHAFDTLEIVRPLFYPYFHDVGAEGVGCALENPTAFQTYIERSQAITDLNP